MDLIIMNITHYSFWYTEKKGYGCFKIEMKKKFQRFENHTHTRTTGELEIQSHKTIKKSKQN